MAEGPEGECRTRHTAKVNVVYGRCALPLPRYSALLLAGRQCAALCSMCASRFLSPTSVAAGREQSTDSAARCDALRREAVAAVAGSQLTLHAKFELCQTQRGFISSLSLQTFLVSIPVAGNLCLV